jgi:hypothetical protein
VGSAGYPAGLPQERAMDLIRNHNTALADCYAGLAIAKLLAGAYPDAGAYLIAAAVYIRAARAELRAHNRIAP